MSQSSHKVHDFMNEIGLSQFTTSSMIPPTSMNLNLIAFFPA